MLASGRELLLSPVLWRPCTASWLSRVDPIQRYSTENAVQQQRTILLAEPDAQLRDVWHAGLAGMGFDVLESTDGRAALRIALRSEIRLLITELYLPTNGERCLVRAIRQEHGLKRVKILVVSEHGATDDRNWALTAGADAFLIKPVRLGRMLQVSARLASSRQQSRAEVRAVGQRGTAGDATSR